MNQFKPGDVVKCISAGSGVVRNKTYTVLNTKQRADGSQVVRVHNSKFEEWWKAERFILESSTSAAPKRENVDVREEQLRAMLTTTSDPFTCKKCGAPKATCTYH